MAGNYFWWTKGIKVLLYPSWWLILMIVVFWVPFLRVWWWLIAPLFLSIELRILYLWWINWDYNYAKIKWVTLEIIPPKEILVPLKAMEDVFTVMWGPLYAPSNWREVYCEGGLKQEASWMSWEIASIEGSLHFYLRVTSSHRPIVESALYSHYPELEIREVSDYTKNVPQNIPNSEWDVYGEDFILVRSAPYPIKTYEKFFEPQGEKISAEEKRLDPIASLLEMLSRLGPGEQFWLQFITVSIDTKDDAPEFASEADKIIAKLTKRPVKKVKSLSQLLFEVMYDLVMGPKKEGSGDKAKYRWLSSTKTEESTDREMVMTPGEREILTEVENKVKKPLFRTNIRGVYVAKRENWKPGNRILTRSYFTHFQTSNLNSVKFSGLTRPKTAWVMRKKIPFIRSRRQFRNYVNRFMPLFPNRTREMAILNPEELATMYHFPFKITGLVSPTMSRVESKKAGPPGNLPI
jgi:hypothetical protein